jgi:hypothetical protein
MKSILKPTKLCYNCFKPHQNIGLYCTSCDKLLKIETHHKDMSSKDKEMLTSYVDRFFSYYENLIINREVAGNYCLCAVRCSASHKFK